MGLTAKKSGDDFQITPSGTYVARCVWVIDLGSQKTVWQGKEKHQHKVLLGFELPDELMEDGRPFFISNRYTLSLSEKAVLRSTLETWRGRKFSEDELEGFDLSKLLGQPCMLTVIHNQKNDKTYANISGIAQMPKGMKCPEQVNQSIKFTLDEFSLEVFETLPAWIQSAITASREYADIIKPPVSDSENPGEDMDDITF